MVLDSCCPWFKADRRRLSKDHSPADSDEIAKKPGLAPSLNSQNNKSNGKREYQHLWRKAFVLLRAVSAFHRPTASAQIYGLLISYVSDYAGDLCLSSELSETKAALEKNTNKSTLCSTGAKKKMPIINAPLFQVWDPQTMAPAVSARWQRQLSPDQKRSAAAMRTLGACWACRISHRKVSPVARLSYHGISA